MHDVVGDESRQQIKGGLEVQLVVADSLSGVRNIVLVTPDLRETRVALIAHGVAVGAIRHKDPVETWAGG